jgi:hypothetical protein
MQGCTLQPPPKLGERFVFSGFWREVEYEVVEVSSYDKFADNSFHYVTRFMVVGVSDRPTRKPIGINGHPLDRYPNWKVSASAKPVPKKQTNSTCPRCTQPALMLFRTVECTNPECRNYR